jgi:glycosyltransferase involved in cell wall biosynthesis
LHEQIGHETFPGNAMVAWAPAETSGPLARMRYERSGLINWCRANTVNAVLQLNGMVIPHLKLPTLAHMQDPWPYRPEAWQSPKDRVVAALKRRQHRRALRDADCVGWTSHYLEKLICDAHGLRPRCSEVFYNGVPESWMDRGATAPNLNDRPMEIVSISNVNVYKRQHLVIQALPTLLKHAGLGKLVYRIAGDCPDEARARLTGLARNLGVADHVVIEGRVSDERVQELFASARCFVLMSVCESFGIPAVEAMSFGTPVVVSDCCAMPEVCDSAAILSPTDQVDALAKNLADVLLQPAVAEDLRKRGFERMRAFKWSATGEQMADRLHRLMNGVPQPQDAFTKT